MRPERQIFSSFYFINTRNGEDVLIVPKEGETAKRIFIEGRVRVISLPSGVREVGLSVFGLERIIGGGKRHPGIKTLVVKAFPGSSGVRIEELSLGGGGGLNLEGHRLGMLKFSLPLRLEKFSLYFSNLLIYGGRLEVVVCNRGGITQVKVVDSIFVKGGGIDIYNGENLRKISENGEFLIK
ncbi:hypothetical protein J7J95_02915 [bacterium]|nr:hypothetical protein [bacterium]